MARRSMRRILGQERTLVAGLAVAILLSASLPGAAVRAADPARQDGDLFVGATFVNRFANPVGAIWRVRGTTATVFCESADGGADPGYWTTPYSVIVDSAGRIVFLAELGNGNVGLLRCDAPGAPAEELAAFRVRGPVPVGWPEPFPDLRFDLRIGSLHVLKQRVITEDFSGAPTVNNNDQYELVAGLQNLTDPDLRGTMELFAYDSGLRQWRHGTKLPGVPQPSGNLTSVVAHDSSLWMLNNGYLRRTSLPLQLGLSGTAAGVSYSFTLNLFGSVHDLPVATLDDTTVPNVGSGCGDPKRFDPPHSGPPSLEMPLVNGAFNSLSGNRLAYDEQGTLGLVVQTPGGPSPYLTKVSSALLNDNPQDDLEGYYHQPFDNCAHVPWVQYAPILPWTSTDSTVAFDNVVDLIATAPGGMVGTSFWGNRVVRLTPGDKVTDIVTLLHPMGIASYPAVVPSLGTVIYFTIHSPVDVLLTDAFGLRIGVDPLTGTAVNDFGDNGFDTGPGEPRVLAIKDPAPGAFRMQTIGTGTGPYRIDVTSADLVTGSSARITASGVASPGSAGQHDFTLDPRSGLTFVGADTTPPTSTVVRTPSANAAGWNNGDVTVGLSATDEPGGSGVQRITYSAAGAQTIPATSVAGSTVSIAVTAEGLTTVSYFATDNAGNGESGRTLAVNIDRTRPSISGAAAPPPNAAGWNNSDVTVTFACVDSGSGIASCAAPATLATEGAGQSATGTATDRAGNRSSSTVAGVNIDTTEPHTTLTQSPVANAAGWSHGPVTLSLTSTDALSGVAFTALSVDGAPFVTYVAALTFSTDGTHTLRFRSTDRADNVETDQTFMLQLDATAPTITGVMSPAANAAGWNNTDVQVTFTCADLGSGLASCSAPAALATEGAGQSAAGSASDRAGNTATTTISGISIDKAPPHTTAARSGAPTSSGWDHSAVTVTLVASDVLSGVARTEVSVGTAPFAPYSGPLTISADGTTVVRYRSTDRAGNVEAEQTLTLRIDRVAPEAIIGFDPATGDIAVTGSDALSGVPAGAIAPITSARARENTTQRTYVVTDRSGNTLTIVIDVKHDGQELTATVVSLSYNGAAAIVAPRNRLRFEWSIQGITIRELQQQIEIGTGGARGQVEAEYTSRSAVTRITVQRGGSDQEGEAEEHGQYPRQIVRPGLVLIQVTTDRGSLAIAY